MDEQLLDIINTMEKYTVEEFQSNFDELIDKVENGKSIIITSEYGNAIMVPYKKYEEMDEYVQLHRDHEEGS